MLLAAAGGRIDDEQLAAVLTSAGWTGRGGKGVHPYTVRRAAGPVDEALDVMDVDQGSGSVTDAGRSWHGLR